MFSLIKNWSRDRKVAKIYRFIESEVEQSPNVPYWNNEHSINEQFRAMLRFYETGFHDGYFANGKHFETLKLIKEYPIMAMSMYEHMICQKFPTEQR